MRINQFDRLNDPFELLSVRVQGKHERYVFKLLRQHLVNSYGVLCMGKHWKSPLMWGHYGENHKGVCLGFDVPDGAATAMNYEPERLEHLIKMGEPAGGLTEPVIEQLLNIKYAQWAYEEEWRLILRLHDKDPINGEYYMDFGPELILREIILGARCQAPVGSFRKLVGSVDHSVTIIKTRAAFESFTIVQQKAVVPIVVSPKRR
ncbi:DUF2971 domain-containing protein [Massilia sp. DJPM01]|uniref:DUF2971 domain-containing protein n=1 Tax=Massilia sp. DJPM01 TaxID=3024404 RepID=UPI00259F2211|nr:DUF2971 domain-containing protein [Massilia sp. DJPM01]MDM5181767.1 DUF2971 domain-containing protein [Massilia sp. DJPM01]